MKEQTKRLLLVFIFAICFFPLFASDFELQITTELPPYHEIKFYDSLEGTASSITEKYVDKAPVKVYVKYFTNVEYSPIVYLSAGKLISPSTKGRISFTIAVDGGNPNPFYGPYNDVLNYVHVFDSVPREVAEAHTKCLTIDVDDGEYDAAPYASDYKGYITVVVKVQ